MTCSSPVGDGGRTFLEVERFDRRGVLHRRGIVSLLALDAEFVGSDVRSWTASVQRLAALDVVSEADVAPVRWRETFGRYIGDTDQHFGNLSFFLTGTRVASLAPAYDVLPSHYAPRGGELSDAIHRPPPPGLAHAETTHHALEAAETFWQRVSRDERVSPDFRHIAARHGAQLVDVRKWLRQVAADATGVGRSGS